MLHGRRRIGKSRLIDEFSHGKTYHNFTGLTPEKNITAQTQRDEFARKLTKYFTLSELKADNWADLFTLLTNQCQKGEVIILLNEISWTGMYFLATNQVHIDCLFVRKFNIQAQ